MGPKKTKGGYEGSSRRGVVEKGNVRRLQVEVADVSLSRDSAQDSLAVGETQAKRGPTPIKEGMLGEEIFSLTNKKTF